VTLKEELEALRGRPIDVYSGDPRDIPCIELSDSNRLCACPIVSVVMITYNHEPYIRRAIEGVMMQKTNFEFELIIGEDCSQDRTREICFEYHKKYPEKIRVLWWHENVFKLGGNGRRARAYCRGEYMAMCEGDDYWTDPNKLQKQVDVMRNHPNVSLCFTNGDVYFEWRGDRCEWSKQHRIDGGVMGGRQFALRHMFGYNDGEDKLPLTINTASALLRVSSWKNATSKFEIFNWQLALGDSTLWLGLSLCGDVYYLPDNTMTYRQNSRGAMQTNGWQVCCDAQIIRAYYASEGLQISSSKWPSWFKDALMHQFVSSHANTNYKQRMNHLRMLSHGRYLRHVIMRPKAYLVDIYLSLGFSSPRFFEVIGRFLRKIK